MFKLIEQIRQENPLIHNITSPVVANDVANALLAIGASPMMAVAQEEMADIAHFAQATVLNTGMLTSNTLESMLIIGQAANQNGIPVILDPVGAGATTFRQQAIQKLLTEIDVQLIRGNAGELACLAGVPWQSKGVDAGKGPNSAGAIAQMAARRYQTVVAISGPEDIITDGQRTVRVFNGHPLMTKITGTGCMLSSICGAFLAVDSADLFAGTVAACTVFAVAGELAVQDLEDPGPGYFRPALMNRLYRITVPEIEKYRQIQEEKSHA